MLHKPDGACYRNCNLFEDSSEVGSGFARQTVRREETIYSFGAQAEIAVVEECAFRRHSDPTRHADPKWRRCLRKRRSPETVPVSMESVVSLVRGGKRVEVSTTIENRARDHRLRVLFPTGIDSGRSASVSRLMLFPGILRQKIQINILRCRTSIHGQRMLRTALSILVTVYGIGGCIGRAFRI